MQDEFNEDTWWILKGGLTKQDQEFIRGNQTIIDSTLNSTKAQTLEEIKANESKPKSNKLIPSLTATKHIEDNSMSKAQIQSIYMLVEQGKLQLNDAMKILPRSEVQKILVMYKKMNQEETAKVNSFNKNHGFKREKRGILNFSSNIKSIVYTLDKLIELLLKIQ